MRRKKEVRVVEPTKREPGFSENLEREARAIVESGKKRKNGSPTKILEREIALTLDRIDRWRQRDSELQRRLFDKELYFDTKLMQFWPGKEEHEPYLWPERDKWKLDQRDMWRDKLLELDKERMKIPISLEERLQPLHSLLLSLLNKHRQLRGENGD